MSISHFLEHSLYFSNKVEKVKQLLLYYNEYQKNLYKEAYGFHNIMTIDSIPKFRNDETVYTLQYTTRKEH